MAVPLQTLGLPGPIRFAALGLALALLPAPARAEMQRMALAPGCYRLAPRQACDADAFCLDRDRPPPGAGAMLSNAPAGLGDAQVRIDGGPPMALQAALDRHVVEIAGVGGGDFAHLRVSNLAAAPVELCAGAASVVTRSRGDPVDDLGRLYPRIGALAAKPAANANDPRQEALWRAVEDARGAGPAPAAGPPSPACGPASTGAVLCFAPKRPK